MSQMQPCVYIVDDDEAVRDALVFLMQSVGLSTQAFATADEFLNTYSDNLAGCLVCDIRMPGMSGLELQDELIQCNATLPIIFITGHGDIPMAVETIKKGAQDFITKPFRDQDLLDCIKVAMAKDASSRNERVLRASLEQRLASLSNRERQVLDLVVSGASNKSIASQLNLSHRTVEVHRSHMMEKMQMRSLAELIKHMQWVQ